MRTIFWQALLVATIAVLMPGCRPGQPISVSSETAFEADGTKYRLAWQAGNPQHHDCSSCLVVQPNSEGNNAVIGTSVSPTSGRYVSIILFPGGSVEAKANTVYYVTDKGIGFSKTYDELGIAAAFFEQWETLGMESVLQKVRPNLEKMIRENLTPSEAKE